MRPGADVGKRGAEDGFNPCCHGLAIAAQRPGAIIFDGDMFQSLLSWISHCGLRNLDGGRYKVSVSILVVMD